LISTIPDSWFDDVPVLGRMDPNQAAAKLRELNDVATADQLEAGAEPVRGISFGLHPRWPIQDRAWQHTGHAFGYVPPDATANRLVRIQHAGLVKADASLNSARVKITLDRLRVAEYPGGGTHLILFDFYAQNQTHASVEHVHFTTTFRARQGEQASVLGYPIFVGLRVGDEGVALKCFTVNVKNEDDTSLLGFLDSDLFRAGLRLASTVQPALATLSGMAVGLTKSLAARRQNVAVQDFFLGLDFSSVATRGRLAEGSYIVLQVPETMVSIWDWRDWGYNPWTGHLVRRASPNELPPYNYLILGVSRLAEST